MELAEFLLARIAEDEALADSLGHIPQWGSKRALAECEAKRRIVEAYREERVRRDIMHTDEARHAEGIEGAKRRRSSAARCRGLEIAVELLALPYADHPDYDPEWKV